MSEQYEWSSNFIAEFLKALNVSYMIRGDINKVVLTFDNEEYAKVELSSSVQTEGTVTVRTNAFGVVAIKELFGLPHLAQRVKIVIEKGEFVQMTYDFASIDNDFYLNLLQFLRDET